MTLARAERAIEQLNILYRDVSTHWAASESRVIGHVILSPPIGIDVGDEGYTEDWAVIEIDASKVDATNFNGNAIDLCIQIPVKQFNHKMYLNVQSGPSFAYPKDRLLRLCGTIPDKEMRKMPDLDQNGDPCLIVMKRGVATGLTVGRANNIASYVRHYYGLPAGTSKEWAILPLDSNSAPFSDPGDSGSVVVDGRGRIGGLLTGGGGVTNSLDITYATPIDFILKRMRANGIYKPNVNPVLTA